MELRRKRGVATFITWPFKDASGTMITGITGISPQYATWTDGTAPNTKFSTISGGVVEIGATGRYYSSLTATEMTNDYLYFYASPTSGTARPMDLLINCMPIATVTQVQNPVPLLWSSITDSSSVVSLSGTTVATISNPVPLLWSSITGGTTAQNLSATRIASVNSPVALLWSSITGAASTQTLSGTTVATVDGITSSVSPDWGRIVNPGTSVNLSLTKLASVSNPVPLLWSSITNPTATTPRVDLWAWNGVAPLSLASQRVQVDMGAVANDTSSSENLKNFFNTTGYLATYSAVGTVSHVADKTGYSLGVGGIAVTAFAAGAIDDAALAADAFVGLLDTGLASGSNVGTNSYRTVAQSLRMLRNKVTIATPSQLMTVTREDDSTTDWTATMATTTDTTHFSGVDPT